jgi:dolichyl-diphosphooligosaccharide--protein glycosyltransferase
MEDAVVQCLRERPQLRETLENIVALDEDRAWAFDDLDCDSGDFGYLVSRPFIEEEGSGYRLVDRKATRRALQRDLSEESETTDSEPSNGQAGQLSEGVRERLGEANTGFWGSFGLALILVFLVRVINYQSVFREDHILSTGNDPYHYRHWVDQLLAESPGLFSFSEIAGVLGGRAASGEPFTYTFGYWLSALAGGPEAVGDVFAWFPVASSLVVAVLTGWMALAVTNDERIAVISVLALAVMPSHALYSGIGFFDHHPVDYLWLAIMAASLVWLARDLDRSASARSHVSNPWVWVVAAVFGLACAASMLSWNGAPLLLVGVGLYAALRPISEIRTTDSPLFTSLPLVAGLGFATAITHTIHTSAGWQEPAVVYAPLIVALGAVATSGLAEAANRFYPDPRAVLAGVVGTGGAGILGVKTVAPEIFARYSQRFSDSLLGREEAVETMPLISTNIGLPFGPVHPYGWFVFFAVPALGYVSWKCLDEHRPRWLVLVSYAWAFLGLSMIQARFMGELSPFVSVFTAVGLLGILTSRDLVRPLDCFSARKRGHARPLAGFTNINTGLSVSLVLVFALFLGIIAIPSAVGPLAYDDSEYESAAWIEDDAETRDDEEYVLSRWGRNRMYNYVVSGGGNGYRYARTHYEDFLNSEDPDQWYSRFENRVGYIIVPNQGGEGSATDNVRLSAYGQLFFKYGSATEVMDGLGHYRLAHVTESGLRQIYRPVPGATIVGTAESGATVTASTDHTVAGESFTYARRTTATEQGQFNVTVAYPGEYSVDGSGNVSVSDEDVEQGNQVRLAEAEQQ